MKDFRHILLITSSLVAAAFSTQAQTLTQDWKVTDGLPTATNARWGVGKSGTIYTNDKSVKKVYAITQTGIAEYATGTDGSAISIDDAGNLILNGNFNSKTSSTTFSVIPAGTTTPQAITLTVPSDFNQARMDFLGRAVGDVMSATGGAFYVTSAGAKKVYKVFLAEGQHNTEKSGFFAQSHEGAADGIIQPMSSNPDDVCYANRNSRSQNGWAHVDGADYGSYLYPTVGSPNTTQGGDVVTLSGTVFTIEPVGADYCDGFQIVDRKNDAIVATHAEENSSSAARPNQNAISIEKIDEYTAKIYQYVPGQMAAQYTFTLPKMYIIGQSSPSAWVPTDGIAMEYKSANVLSATVTTSTASKNIAFVSVLAENNDSGGWSYVNANRYGCDSDNKVISTGDKYAVSKNSNAMYLGLGTFYIELNLEDNTVYAVPTKLYVIGNTSDRDDHDWASDDDGHMVEADPANPGVFTFNPIDMKVYGKAVGDEDKDDYSYFALTTYVGSGWTDTNDNRWSPTSSDTEITAGVDFTGFGRTSDGDSSFKIKNGAYKMVVNLNDKTINCTYLTTTGVTDAKADACRVYAADGAVRIDGEHRAASVYTVAGQAIVLNSEADAINVASGLYIVVVDGKATKVVVR